MKKIGMALIAAIFLTGCVQPIDLTQQESDIISEYAAFVTLKYDKKYDKKLVEESKIESEEEEASDKDNVPEEEAADTKETQNSEDTEDTSTDKDASDRINTEGTNEGITDNNLAQLFAITDYSIEYTGLEYAQEYPQDEEKYHIKAEEGKEYLILKFNVTNKTDKTILCDLLSISPKFELAINGTDKIKNYVTLLENDLSTLCNQVEAGASMEAVLIAEIDKELEGQVESVDLSVSLSGKTTDYKLQ